MEQGYESYGNSKVKKIQSNDTQKNTSLGKQYYLTRQERYCNKTTIPIVEPKDTGSLAFYNDLKNTYEQLKNRLGQSYFQFYSTEENKHVTKLEKEIDKKVTLMKIGIFPS